MNSLSGLVVRLERADAPCRRLDAEILAALLGPPGCVVADSEGLDGWDINHASDREGMADLWREAAEVDGVTAFVDSACDLVRRVYPQTGGALLVYALRRMPDPAPDDCVAAVASRVARTIVAELLRKVAAEERMPAAQAA